MSLNQFILELKTSSLQLMKVGNPLKGFAYWRMVSWRRQQKQDFFTGEFRRSLA